MKEEAFVGWLVLNKRGMEEWIYSNN